MVKDGIPGERITVVHSGIDPARFEGVTPHDIRAEFGLPADARIVGDVAAFGWHKAQEFLVRATPRLTTTFPARLAPSDASPCRHQHECHRHG